MRAWRSMYSSVAPSGPGHADVRHATILGGRELARQHPEEDRRERHHGDGAAHDRPGTLHQMAQRVVVAFRQPVEERVDDVREARPRGATRQQLRGEHRRQGQRDQRGEEHGGRDREAELPEELADGALEEGHRHEHRDQHGGGCDHREADLAAAVHRRDQRRFATLHASVDVLEHDDRIVHHEADREHETEQGENVDRESHRCHHQERRDDRHGDRERGDQRGAHVAEEQVDHHQHQHQRDDQRDQHLLHRFLDEYRAVEVDLEACAGRKVRSQTLDLVPDVLRDLERIRLRDLLDGDADAGHAIRARNAPFVLSGETHVGHLVEPHQVAVRPAADRKLAEFLLGGEPGVGAQREFALRGFEPARRELYVLTAQCRLDVGDGEPARGQRLAIEPDPHRVAPGAVQPDARHARQHAQPLDQDALTVVGQFERR